MLRILDSLTDLQFETTAAGDVIYYPHGVFGRGYRVPAEQRSRVRQAARYSMLLTLVGVFLLFLLPRLIDYPDAIKPFSLLITYSGLAVLLAVTSWLAWRAVSGLQSVEPPPWRERLRHHHQISPAWVFWLSIACGLLFGAISLAAILGAGYENQQSFNVAVGVLVLPLSIALFWYGALGLRTRASRDSGR